MPQLNIIHTEMLKKNLFNPKIIIFLFLSLIMSSCSNKIIKTNASAIDFCSSIHRNDSLSFSKELEPVENLMKDKTGVYVLEDGGGSMVVRAWLSEYAEKTIDIQYFIFSTDNVGLIACDYLIRAADRGVKVRLLVDDIMVEADGHELLMMDSHENIEIKVYNPGVNLGKNLFSRISKFATDFKSAKKIFTQV